MKLNLLHDRNTSERLTWMIILFSFYYPLSACTIILFGLPSTLINICIRGLFSFLAFGLIVSYFKKKTLKPLKISTISLVVFWVYYLSKIVFDTQSGIKFSEYSNAYIYTYVLGCIILPIITIILWVEQVDLEYLVRKTFNLFVLTNLTIICTLIFVNKGFDLSIFLKRSELQAEESGNVILNPIMIGFHGEMVIILSIYFLFFKQERLYSIWVYLIISIIGSSLILLGASRGPFVGVFLSLLALLVYQFMRTSMKFIYIFKVAIFLILIVSLGIYFLGDIINLDNVYMFQRIAEVNDKGIEEEYRTIAFRWALNDFLSSPILGKHFVSSYDNFYPHNIAIELLMATGIIGLLFFLGFYYKVILKYINIFTLKPSSFSLLLIYTPILLLGLTSGSLFQSNDFWLFTVLVAFKSLKS